MGRSSGDCGSGSRTGCPLIRGLVVQSPFPAVSKCPWAGYTTGSCPRIFVWLWMRRKKLKDSRSATKISLVALIFFYSTYSFHYLVVLCCLKTRLIRKCLHVLALVSSCCRFYWLRSHCSCACRPRLVRRLRSVFTAKDGFRWQEMIEN